MLLPRNTFQKVTPSPPPPRPLTPQVPDISVPDAQKNFKKSMEKGILKILSKMGISLLSCYHGAQIFEIYGLGKDVVDLCFKGSVSRIGGCPGCWLLAVGCWGYTSVGWALECQLCCTLCMCCVPRDANAAAAAACWTTCSSECFWSSCPWC